METQCPHSHEHCKWLFGIIFIALTTIILAIGWSAYAGYAATSAAQSVEIKFIKKEERDAYLIQSIQEIKAEQLRQRKMLEDLISRRH